MLSYIAIGIALFGSSIASYFDVKTTEVPDIIAIYMAILGVILNATRSFLTGNNTFILSSLIVGGIFTVIGAVKYYTKLWGGADFLILGALGFLIPVFPQGFSATLGPWPYPVTLFLNILLVGCVYTIIYATVIALRKKEILSLFLKNMKSSGKILLGSSIAYIILIALMTFFGVYISNTSYGTILPFLLKRTIPYFLILIFLTVFLKTIQYDILDKRISTKKLKEGDVLANKVLLKNKTISADKIVGLTKEQVTQIRSEKKYVKITQGVPYVPVFPISIIITLFVGDIISKLMVVIS